MAKKIERRTSIMTAEVLADRVIQHCAEREESLTDFYNRAILNQLENDGDFEIRDLFDEAMAKKGDELNGTE